MSMMQKTSRERSGGFTILELMIATAVFSLVLLLITTAIMQVTKVYYKGITEANTQNVARNIIETISQAIQFSGGEVTTTEENPDPGTDYAFCIGNEQFSYQLGQQVEDGPIATKNQTWHALVQKSGSGAGCSSPVAELDTENGSDGGRDLISKHMRLSKLEVKDLGNYSYKVTVRVVYGDDDILNDGTATTSNASCKGQSAGSSFCAVSELSTIVVKRVE